MRRHSFQDCDGKRGKAGTDVMLCWMGEAYGDRLTVEKIASKGRDGTYLYFTNGHKYVARGVRIIE